MSYVTSEIAVCNLALDYLKQEPVVNITSPTTVVEALLARQSPQARRAALRRHPWNFATKRVGLTASLDQTPAFGYTHAFKKPNDFIRLLSRHDSDGVRLRDEYDLEGDYILMDSEDDATLYIRYTSDFTTVAKMDPLFIDVWAMMLALRIAPKFSGSENRGKVISEQLLSVLAEAKSIDGQERPPRKVEYSEVIQKRRFPRARYGNQSYTYFS